MVLRSTVDENARCGVVLPRWCSRLYYYSRVARATPPEIWWGLSRIHVPGSFLIACEALLRMLQYGVQPPPLFCHPLNQPTNPSFGKQPQAQAFKLHSFLSYENYRLRKSTFIASTPASLPFHPIPQLYSVSIQPHLSHAPPITVPTHSTPWWPLLSSAEGLANSGLNATRTPYTSRWHLQHPLLPEEAFPLTSSPPPSCKKPSRRIPLARSPPLHEQ